MARMVEAQDLHPLIDRVVPLDDIHAGFQSVLEGTHSGKIVVRVAS